MDDHHSSCRCIDCRQKVDVSLIDEMQEQVDEMVAILRIWREKYGQV